MKKAQTKSIFIFALVMLLVVVAIYATTITLNHPSDEWSLSSSVNFNFTPASEVTTIPWCSIYANDTGSYVVKANYSNVPNSSDFVRGISFGDSSGLEYTWNVSCYNGTEVDWQATGATFGVDANAPTITLDAPTDDSYQTSLNLKYTPTDASNPDTCLLYTNISGSWAVNQTNASFVSGTQILMPMSSVSDGRYIWNSVCNDTASNLVWAEDTNRTFTMDTTSPTVVRFTNPANNTYSDDSTPTISWNKTVDINFQKYVVNLSDAEDMSNVIQSKEITTITSNTTTLDNIGSDGQYYVKVASVDSAGNSQVGTYVLYYYLDSDTGTITMVYPEDEAYLGTNDVDLNFTVTDDNPDSCWLWLSNSSTISATTVVYKNTTVASTAGVVSNFTVPDMIDGGYNYNIECNDSNGVSYNLSSSLLNVTVDTTPPSDTNLTMTIGGKNSTDGTPTITWRATTENNFDKYVVSAYNESNSALLDQENISAVGTLTITLDVPFDHSVFFNVSAYDKAGNVNGAMNSTAQSLTYIDSLCATLNSGWNVCGLVRSSAKNLSTIAAEVDATFISIYNETKQFQTCNYVLGEGGTNCNRMVGGSASTNNATHVWVYVNSSTLWEDRVWETDKYSYNITLTNVSTNGWNIFTLPVRNGLTFEDLNQSSRLGNNVTFYSLPYNNGTSVPFIAQPIFNSLKKDTQVDYGRAMWVFTNQSSKIFDIGVW